MKKVENNKKVENYFKICCGMSLRKKINFLHRKLGCGKWLARKKVPQIQTNNGATQPRPMRFSND